MRKRPRKKRAVEFSLYEFKGEFGTLRVMAMTPAQGAEIAREILSKLQIYEGALDLVNTISFPEFRSQR